MLIMEHSYEAVWLPNHPIIDIMRDDVNVFHSTHVLLNSTHFEMERLVSADLTCPQFNKIISSF